MQSSVPFMTVEDGDDLIVSFALGPHAERSLTLLRTPKYERFLPEAESGVSVSTGGGSDDGEMLLGVSWGASSVRLVTTTREFRLDVGGVDPQELRQGRAVLGKMNFDECIEVVDVELVARRPLAPGV